MASLSRHPEFFIYRNLIKKRGNLMMAATLICIPTLQQKGGSTIGNRPLKVKAPGALLRPMLVTDVLVDDVAIAKSRVRK